ncbi:MAG TPA: hypothetical protein VHD76_23175 [Bryobacteraceae bacterium]|jgi:hypothetical protein|nr:hypothetical protein [Bryobacteraceae bacterium]
MTRAFLQCVFAAVLALLCAQPVEPSPRAAAAIELVRGVRAERQTPQKRRCVRECRFALKRALPYQSPVAPRTEASVRFQRPPPAASLFA